MVEELPEHTVVVRIGLHSAVAVEAASVVAAAKATTTEEV